MFKLAEKVKKQAQEGVLVVLTPEKTEKRDDELKEVLKLTRKERKLLKLLEERQYNPRYDEEMEVYYLRKEVRKYTTEPLVNPYAQYGLYL